MKYPYKLPPLPYAYDALEPYIDTETMHYHHDKHFANYINKLNEALAPYPELQELRLDQLLANPEMLPPESQQVIMDNAGGVYNHNLFFEGLAPAGGASHQPTGQMLGLINSTFGSADAMKVAFSAQAASVFGSGWSCLALDPSGNLQMVTLKDQETTISRRMIPLLLFDVWEHAYYLKYKNMRADYIKNLWDVIVFPELVPNT